MSKGKSDKITYKPCGQHQPYLIPPSAGELIPQDHLARLVNEVIDGMGIERLLRKYQAGGGASRHHPVMMAKLSVYGYMTKARSSRMPAKAARENVMFMRLSGNQRPDFRTPNDFRGNLLKGAMEEIFVKMLAVKGYIKLENYFADGTKIEGASGRPTFVRKKAVGKNGKKLDGKLRAYIKTAEQAWEGENLEYGNLDLEEPGGKEKFTRADVKALAGILKERIERLEACKDKKKLKEELKTAEKENLPRKKKYEKAKRICGKRDSYSKTGKDAAFMRMKEDHMGDGQLKPAYNVQIGTENGFAVGYGVFQNPGGTRTLKPHLRRQAKRLGAKPKTVIADAGYGSEENYQYLENCRTAAVVQYNTYRKEKSRKWQEDAFRTDNWEYNKKGKYYACPNGRKLTFRETTKEGNGSGYLIKIDRYECESCKYCRLRKQCAKAKGNRSIQRNGRLLRLKRKARRVLEGGRYGGLRKQRPVEVETVFGQIKGNQGYRRFLLRGMAKASAEWGLLSLGYNLKQIYRVNRGKTA
jgi:transposase